MGLYEDALERFKALLQEAREHPDIGEPTAMTLATTTAAGRPSARTVLLKQIDERGFVFYTNTRSRKGRQLAENPRAALTFFWAPLVRQVLVEGDVAPVADAEADAYFASRPRLSQIGAWASQQSEPLSGRDEFEARVAELEARFDGREVPRPPHWTGYRIRPDLIEFWHGREGRLHDRDRYHLEDGEWRWMLLNP
ncbi:pyridoxamine 5'-phosphate oxidase [Sediminicurvatus halobius]|uniref:Pyridoxine/pyridoxamine 5'-phosphate oxidase n=1 Tax=Sediminicurvatus halobius TaxID=2182432 RepID=A0A2U2N4G0_9GAMM|nr:pyridoxamine 5'-phosphate oxidase [Spiribacter halobius]PWG64066.1 pyridoxamine 5'-phosphate oxidase [Spiribacter halobius]UEX76879.1 pyridoxamine 5'-phosphate oxidase [Spiribacter halobius]